MNDSYRCNQNLYDSRYNNMEEIWKDIAGYEGWYQVSNLGRVKSLDRYVNGNGINCDFQLMKGKFLKGSKDKLGYYRVHLRKNVTYKSILVHRLVAEAFLPNPNNLPYINHKDENPSNNSLCNLEWCTPQYNVTYGTAIERSNRTKYRKVIQFDKNGNEVARWDSLKAAAKSINRAQQNISRCCRGKAPSCGGYIWKYEY